MAHPIVDHTQAYVVSSECIDDDVLGQVHYLCTDSIFNDRTGDAYAWSIISGNGAGYCAVGASTGVLTVSSASAITSNAADITLGIEISYGSDVDTATCFIYYRTNAIHIDLDKTDAGDGSRSNPYPGTYNWGGARSGGETILFARGTDITGTTHSLSHTYSGDRIIYGAYGTGHKPEFLYNGGGSNAYPFYLSIADYATIMDLKFFCGWVDDADDYETIGIIFNTDSDHGQLYRIDTDGSGNNAAIYARADFSGADAVTYNEYYDIQGDNNDSHRIIKSEAAGPVIRNLFGTNNNGSFLYACLNGGDQGSEAAADVKYLYTKGRAGSSSGYAIDFRSRGNSLEWACIRDWNYAIAIYEYDYYSTTHPSAQMQYYKNILIETTTASAIFTSVQGADFDDAPSATFENVVVYDAGLYGFSWAGPSERLTMINCIVIGSTSYGVYADGDTDTLHIVNSILLDNGTYDANIGGVSYDTVMNTIWDTYSNDAVLITNYDFTTDGDPFVDEPGGDYRSAVGEGTIDNGTAWYLTEEDILKHIIGTVDIGPFEYPSTDNFNWTKQ